MDKESGTSRYAPKSLMLPSNDKSTFRLHSRLRKYELGHKTENDKEKDLARTSSNLSGVHHLAISSKEPFLTLHTINGVYSSTPATQTNEQKLAEKNIFNDNDVLLVADYSKCNTKLIISCGKIRDIIDLRLHSNHQKFLLHVLRGFDLKSNIRILPRGKIEIFERKGMFYSPKVGIKMDRPSVLVHFRAVPPLLTGSEVNGSLEFLTTGEDGTMKQLFKVNVKLVSQLPCYLERSLSPMVIKRTEDGYEISEKSVESFIACIKSEDQLDHFHKLEMGLEEITKSWLNRTTVVFLKSSDCRSESDENLFTAFFKILSMNNDQIQSLTVQSLEINFVSFEKMKDFRQTFKDFIRHREKFFFKLQKISVKSYKYFKTHTTAERATFEFLVSLTSQKSCLPVVKMLNGDIAQINQLSMTFMTAKLKDLEISAQIHAETFDDLLKIIKQWKLREAEKYNLDKLSFQFASCDYFWLFHLTKMPSNFDRFCIGIEKFRFNRENMGGIIKFLSDKELTESSNNVMMVKRIVIEVALHDSRREMSSLIGKLCESLHNVSIEICQLQINIESDDSGWAFFRFNLTKIETMLKVKGVTITFPKNCTDNSRVVSVEIHTFPKDLIEQVNFENKTNIQLSPLVCINQKEDFPFLQPVSVCFLYPTNPEKVKTKVFSKYDQERIDAAQSLNWQEAPDFKTTIQIDTEDHCDSGSAFHKKCHDYSSNGELKLVCYESRHFSPVVAMFETEDSQLNPTVFTKPYFVNCAFVTILPLETRRGNVVFDCIKVENEDALESLSVSEYFEKRKVGKMKEDDELSASCAKNLEVAEPELDCEKRLRFCCPDHLSNQQEYKMKKTDVNGDWRGFIHYYKKSERIEKKIFHMGYHVPTEPLKSMSAHQNPNEPEKPVSQPNKADERRSFLEKAWFDLHLNIQNSSLICSYLFSNHEMSETKADEIQSEKVKHKSNLELIKHVLARGPRAYDKLREAMIKLEEPQHLIDLLPKIEDKPNTNAGGETSISPSLHQVEDILEAEPIVDDAN